MSIDNNTNNINNINWIGKNIYVVHGDQIDNSKTFAYLIICANMMTLNYVKMKVLI